MIVLCGSRARLRDFSEPGREAKTGVPSAQASITGWVCGRPSLRLVESQPLGTLPITASAWAQSLIVASSRLKLVASSALNSSEAVGLVPESWAAVVLMAVLLVSLLKELTRTVTHRVS